MMLKEDKYFRVFLFLVVIVSFCLLITNIFIYQYKINVYGPIGASASYGNITLFVEGDITPPEVIIVGPNNASYSSGDVDVDIRLNENGSCRYSTNAGANNISMNTTNNRVFTGQLAGLADGSYKLDAYCNDTRYNLNNSEFVYFSVASAGAGVEVVVPGSGGAASIVRNVTYDFGIDHALVKVTSPVGERYKKIIKIANPNKITLNIRVLTNLNFINISETAFSIKPKEEKILDLEFYAPAGTVPRTYSGRIYFVTQHQLKKELPVIFEATTKKVLFEVSLNIPAEYKRLDFGQGLFFQTTLFSAGDIKKATVDLIYEIMDFEDNIIFSETEEVYVDNQISFSKTIAVPEDIEEGDYVIAVKAVYGGTVSTASDVFSVGKLRAVVSFVTMLWFFAIAFGALFLAIVIYYEWRSKQLKGFMSRERGALARVETRIATGRVKYEQAAGEIAKLKLQKSLLEKAYQKGYIRKATYEQTRKKIDGLINKLRKKYL